MKNEEPLIAKSNLVLGLCRASDLIPKRDIWTRRGMYKASVCNSKEQLVFFKTCRERLCVKHCVLQSSFLKFKVLHIPDYILSSQCQLLVTTYCIVHFFSWWSAPNWPFRSSNVHLYLIPKGEVGYSYMDWNKIFWISSLLLLSEHLRGFNLRKE